MIQLEGIRFGYPARPDVLDDLDFRCGAGDRVGVVGANGSGKTTLLHITMGLVKPEAGRVVLFGSDRSTEDDFRDARRRIGFVFQDADDQLFCPTVAEDVAFGPRNLGKSADEAHEIVHRILELLGIEHLESRVTYQLSGGEKRLVALATVLAMDPEILILDEPTTGLDEGTAEHLLEILDQHAPTYVIVSHDRTFLERAVSSTFLLRGGRLYPQEMAEASQTAVR
jgi:cobalt/nickel transport system ATP-binding protein